MSKFVEVLVDGLTVRGQVRSAGETVQVPGDFPMQSKRKQVKRWGHPKFHEISRDDFLNQGGQELENDPVEPKAPGVAETPEDASVESSVGGAHSFSALEGLNVEDTLTAVADFDEDELQTFVAYERDGDNRSGVLGPLGAE